MEQEADMIQNSTYKHLKKLSGGPHSDKSEFQELMIVELIYIDWKTFVSLKKKCLYYFLCILP